AAQTPWPNAAGTGFSTVLTVSWAGIGGTGPNHVSSLIVALIVVGAVCACTPGGSFPVGWGAAWRHSAWWTTVGLLLAAPVIELFGVRVHTPLHQLAKAVVPAFVRIARIPERYGVISMVGIPLLAGLSVAACGV